MAAEEVAGNAQVLHGPVAFVLGIDGMLSLVLTKKKKKIHSLLLKVMQHSILNTSLLGGEKVICNITTLLLCKKM